MKHYYDDRSRSNYLVLGGDYREDALPSLTFAMRNGVVNPDPFELIANVYLLLRTQQFAWGRGENSRRLDGKLLATPAINGLVGYVQPSPKDAITSITLKYPKNMSVLRALDMIESIEGGGIRPFLIAVLLSEDYALRQYEAKNIPEFFVSYAQMAWGEVLFDFPPYDPQGQSIPDRKTDDSIKRAIQAVPMGVFDGTLDPTITVDGEQPGVDYVTHVDAFHQMFPGVLSWRSVDVANLIWQFSLYLWSKDWWGSDRMIMEARQEQSSWSRLIAAISAISTASRRPVFTVQGIPLAAVTPKSRTDEISRYTPTFDMMRGDLDPMMETMTMVWFQLVEFYSMGITEQALRDLLPDGVLTIKRLGVDYLFDVSETIEQLRWGRNNLLDRADKDSAYAPVGSFRLDLPQELLDVITNLELVDQAGLDDPFEEHIDLDHFVLSVDTQGIWLKIMGKKGPGPIVRWNPRQPLQTNMISATFGIILDIILAALWHDMRVAGEGSLRPRISKENGSPRRRHGKSSATREQHSLSLLPRTPTGQPGIRFTGRREWSTDEERQTIKRIAHSVVGHRRTLPVGWQPSDRAKQLAETAGIHLPPGVTYVSPSVRGGQAGEPVDVSEPPTIVSKGLAMIMAFLMKDQKKAGGNTR